MLCMAVQRLAATWVVHLLPFFAGIGAGRNDYFPLSMNKTYAKMLEYQALLDSKAPEGRAAIMGNILW